MAASQVMGIGTPQAVSDEVGQCPLSEGPHGLSSVEEETLPLCKE